MASKYCDTTATYNGDGTALTPAASAGAAGAWNDLKSLINMAPAYGSLSAGDVVTVRTYNAGNITYSPGAWPAPATAIGTASAPVTFLFDDGTVWGTGGVFTYSYAGKNRIKLAENTRFFNADGVRRYRFYVPTGRAGGSGDIGIEPRSSAAFGDIIINGAIIEDVYDSALAGYGHMSFYAYRACGPVRLQNCEINQYNYASVTANPFFAQGNVSVENCQVRFKDNGANYPASTARLADGLNGGVPSFSGGSIVAEGGVANIYRLGALYEEPAYSTNIKFLGTKLVGIVWDAFHSASAYNVPAAFITVTEAGPDHEAAYINSKLSTVSWEGPSANFPTLNALLPDGSTPWSYKVVPGSIANVGQPILLPPLVKRVTTLGTYTVTVEFLVKDTFPTPDKSKIWIDVTYTDSGGTERTLSSFAISGALTAGSAWSGPTTGFTAYKASVTMPGNVAADELLKITVNVALASAGAGVPIYVDPEAVLS